MSRYRTFARLLAALPATNVELAAHLGHDNNKVSVWTNEFRALGVISRKSMIAGSWLWALEPCQPYQRKVRGEVLRFALAWKQLASRSTTYDVARAIGTTRRTAVHIINQMREAGIVRRAGWVSSGHTRTPVFDRAQGADAPPLPRKPRSETNAEYWARNGDRYLASAREQA